MMVFLPLQRLAHICILFLLVVPLTAGARSESHAAAIESITVVAAEGEPEKMLIRLNASHSPKTFQMDGQRPRLVFDFYNVRYLSDKLKIAGTGGDIISGIRVGRHDNPQKTRIVVDIVPGSTYQYDQLFDMSSNSLEIRFQPVEPEALEAGKRQHLRAESLKIVRTADTVADTAAAEDKQETAEEKTKPAEKEPEITPPAESSAESPAEVVVLGADNKKQKGVADPAVEPAESDTGGEENLDPPIILDISFEESINNSETVLFKLSHFHPPLVFGIEKGTPRVVCDFIGGEVKANVPAVIDSGGTYVTRITVTGMTDPKKVRVELELATNHHYDLQQLFFKEDNLFVVIVNELEE